MSARRAPKKQRRSKPKRSHKKQAPRAKRVKKAKKAPAKKRSSPKRSPPKQRPPPKRSSVAKKKRSEAAKKGWDTRRKKQRLIEAMAEHRLRASENLQPIGWTQHRAEIREINGEIWREIAVEYSESDHEAARLAALGDLEIDLLNKDELYDYLTWIADEYDIDIGDLYEMYLGYTGDD